MTAGITLTEAITALVTEKRAVGYKYHAERQVLARFEAFSRSEFPGLDTLTQSSVQAWITAARRREVKPATLQGLAAPVRELARWLGRRGVAAYLLPKAALPRPACCSPNPTGPPAEADATRPCWPRCMTPPPGSKNSPTSPSATSAWMPPP
jgi:hypothetical protein